ncbi:VOC family protein [Nitrosomonas sp. Is37]|uniref:VOC family protein n=1 Tax=Nitrosomonas sp. Is37 TaxID=3080535 RepID=UPI00294B6394|nr:VOC family protein [Nitrosomonas sp. Is37]MDV6343264.1 VOC family protein [Nitrosomonas sp. Is37]
MNTISYFEIQSAHPEAAVNFYREIFGWRFTKDEDIPIPYWRIETDGIRGGLLQRPAPTPPQECGTNAYVCSVEVVDIDTLADKIELLGGQVALPKFAVPGVCWHAYFVDPDGNTFGLFQPDPEAR